MEVSLVGRTLVRPKKTNGLKSVLLKPFLRSLGLRHMLAKKHQSINRRGDHEQRQLGFPTPFQAFAKDPSTNVALSSKPTRTCAPVAIARLATVKTLSSMPWAAQMASGNSSFTHPVM